MAIISTFLAHNLCSILVNALPIVDKIHTSTGVVYGGLVVPEIKLVVMQIVLGFLHGFWVFVNTH